MNLVRGAYEFYALLIKRVYNSEYFFIIDYVVKLNKKYSFKEISNKKLVFAILLEKYSYNNTIISICFEHIRESLLIILKQRNRSKRIL